MEPPRIINLPVKTSNSLYHVDYTIPVNQNAEYRPVTKTSHDFYPEIPQNFDFKVPLRIRPGLSLSDPSTGQAVKQSEYEREFEKKAAIVENENRHAIAPSASQVSYARNVQEKVFQNPPKPKSHFLSEMNANYTFKQPIVDYDQVYPPEPYAKCEVRALGRDEQPKIRPEEKGFYKWLDPYMTTYAATHVPFTTADWEGIAKKDIITFYDIIGAPKSKGFGPKISPQVDPLVPSKNYYMQDKIPFKLKIQERLVRVAPKRVPHNGMKTTYREEHGPQTEHPLWTYLSDPGVDYPEAKVGTSKFQDLCPPGMYKTEYQTLGSVDGVNVIVDTDKLQKIKNVL